MSGRSASRSDDVSLVISVARLKGGGLPVRFAATPEQRRAIARRFDIVDVERFQAEMTATSWGGDGVCVEGDFQAEVVQIDVVTLDPLRRQVAEPLRLFFVPEGSTAASNASLKEEAVIDLDPADNAPETFRGDRLDLGESLVQVLGLALDPYPRGEDSAFDDVREGEEEPSPFAVLARLQKSED